MKITKWPDADHKNLVGEVVDVLGEAGDNDVEMNTILAQYGLPYKYPKRVEDAAEKISAEITAQDYAEREDFRDVWTCTIDPRDAKDFDDALSIRKLESGLWEVGVHIADVSHYVKEGDIIDREAQQRATSVYLVTALSRCFQSVFVTSSVRSVQMKRSLLSVVYSTLTMKQT